jgi:peptide/nickel transport system permease protein
MAPVLPGTWKNGASSNMFGFFIRRLIASIPVLLVVSICAFSLIHMAHGDPAVAMFGSQLEKMRVEDQMRIRENLGLNQPLTIQYLKWFSGVLQGELGRSYIDGRDVRDIIMSRLPSTLVLNVAALVLMMIVAVGIGVLSAIKQYSWFDYLSTGFAFLFYAVPSFWLALLSILVFCVYLGWLPSSGLSTIGREFDFQDRLVHLILPTIVLAVSHVGAYIRFVRASMLEILNQEYILTAQAKGLRKSTIYFTHAFRNALIPLLTYAGMSFSSLIGGAYLVETVFAYPGIGQLTIHAAATRDYPLLMGTVLLTGVFVVAGNLLADVCCAWADPRLQLAADTERRTVHG